MIANFQGVLNTQTLAAAGSSLATAGQVDTRSPLIVHATGADGTKGIKLPSASKGSVVFIKNSDAANQVLKVYPGNASDQINAITAGSALSMAAKTSAVFVAFNTVTWFTFSLLPS